LLRGEAVPKRTGVELPTRPGVKLLRVSAQALRRVVLRVDRNRHQVQAIIRRQLALQRCESLAGERSRRFAGGEDEIHYHGAPVVELLGERYALATFAHQ